MNENPWFATVRAVVASVVPVPELELEAPGPFRFADVANLLPLLDQAGFRDLRSDNVRLSLPVGGGMSPEDAATFALTSFSTFVEMLGGAETEAFQTAQNALEGPFSRQSKGGHVWMDASVHIVSGARA